MDSWPVSSTEWKVLWRKGVENKELQYHDGEALLMTVGDVVGTSHQTFGTDNNIMTSDMLISSREC